MTQSRVDRTLLALIGVTLLALVTRLWNLGGRVFHWDEGRVGYWTLRYAETGEFSYAPIIHGPFIPLVNGAVFDTLGASDATARLVVAVIGGLVPLSVWLFRKHLRDTEVVIAGALFGFNPLLIYYSRFMRNDVLVAGFTLAALGFAVRALDTRQIRYGYPAVAFLALSLTTKANTLLYLLCFGGAAVLLVDQRLVRRASAEPVRDILREWAGATVHEVKRVGGGTHPFARLTAHLVGMAVVFTVIIVAFYAPRPFVYEALGQPSQWTDLLRVSTVGAATELWDLWITGGMQGNPYFEYLYGKLDTLANTAAVVVGFAVIGFLVDGYTGEPARAAATQTAADGSGELPADTADETSPPNQPSGSLDGLDSYTPDATASDTRDTDSDSQFQWLDTTAGSETVEDTPGSRPLVAFAAYWGLASLIGYPVATDILAPWSTVHIVVPLVFPAAVGLAWVVKTGVVALDSRDRVNLALAGVVLLVAIGGVAVPAATYWNTADPGHDAIIQYSQPDNEVRGLTDDIAAVAPGNEGPDVMFVGTELPGRGETFYLENESVANQQPAAGGWYDRLPLPWYLERAGAEPVSVPPNTSAAAVAAEAPPVVIAHVDDRERLEPHLDGYTSHEYTMRQDDFRVVVFTDRTVISE
jgi:TIGR03663 family protein